MVTFESATDRLNRLLTMVPWLMRNQGIDIAEAAQTFGVNSDQIVEDLQLLFVCGTPGHLPDDLIEASWEGGKVYVGNAETISHPLRLGRDEALALIVALRTLAASTGAGEADAIERALAKLEAAAGGTVGLGAAQSLSVTIDSDEMQQQRLGEVRAALAAARRIHLRYVVASRDEATERDVDPMRVLSVDGRWYVEGWCHRARDVRLFRLDRMEDLQVLDVDGRPPPQATPRPIGPGVFAGKDTDMLITLNVDPEAAWVADQFPVESTTERDDGTLEIRLRAADPRWLVRLVWRFGGSARVIAPEYVIQMVRDGAASALRGDASRPA